jgi:hypothetical protein
MASLTEWADAARAEAARSRLRSVALRVEIRRQVRTTIERRQRVIRTLELLEESRARPILTAWSKLPWRHPTRQDEAFLELVDR